VPLSGVWCDWEFSESWDKSLDEFFESGFWGWDGIDEAIVHIASGENISSNFSCEDTTGILPEENKQKIVL